MFCCYKHQQQRHDNENTKMCMLIHYMYVDILFPLTKAIPIMFEDVTTYYQSSMISYLIFLNKFFLHLDAESASSWIHPMELFVNISKFI